MAKKKQSIKQGATLTTKEVAYVCGCSVQFLLRLVKEGVVQQVGRNRFGLDAVKALYERRDKKQSIEEANLRLTTAKADLAELELQQERDEMVRTDVAVAAWEKVVKSVRQRLLAVPIKLAPLLITCKSVPELKDALEKSIYEVLTELANPCLSNRKTKA